MEILQSLPPMLKLFWLVAIPVSIIFLIQTVMTFAGADGHDGLNADFDSTGSHDTDTPFELFSLRNLINFLLGFSWAGISLYSSIQSPTWLVIAALAVGVLFVYVFFLVIRQIQKLAEDNSFNITQTLNATAEVYLTIPGNMSGKGKVMVSVKGSTRELEAMTASDKIASGSVVRIVKIENGNILIVEKI
ncbi:serine protease [Pseudoflavitalea sp. G-6-1-2]|uniref:NfeD family protein n=1 Tax=Pseudoflavitalea sp. G-6-1-2 TaxID=2728841 RepID=UPI00146ED51D|nr:NfeD family protein [Pseudoflavitalea sp. G-6-1-2]NML22261.1 serine protease [Pseudoflavitalea sp. G-6-1-2]